MERVQAGHYDVVLMDMQMPVMDGYTATRGIRQWEQSHNRGPSPSSRSPPTPRAETRNKCLEAGCTDYLAKPIKKAALFAVIAEHVREATLSEERERATAESAVMVRADPAIADLIPAFMHAMRSRMDTLAQALHARVTGPFARLAIRCTARAGPSDSMPSRPSAQRLNRPPFGKMTRRYVRPWTN